jgi:hypothetical protein
MKPNAFIRRMLVVLLASGLGSSFVEKSAGADFSGIVEYAFEPNPQAIKPKMYNWEIKLNGADSRKGLYEIVQITKPGKPGAKAADTAPDVLVESRMITPNREGIIDFNLYVGDREPKQNMGRRGNCGQPIIFSGKGTGKGASSWIILPGAKVDRVVPSGKGTRLSGGELSLIRFRVINDRGEPFQADVVLRRK